MQHNLKIDPVWLEAVVDGRKKAEVRRADRPFSVGDELLLYVPGTEEGALVRVTHIVNVAEVRGLGCSAPLAVLSIEEPRKLTGNELDAQLAVGNYAESHVT